MHARSLPRYALLATMVALVVAALAMPSGAQGRRARAPRRDGHIFVLPAAPPDDQEMDRASLDALVRTAVTTVPHGATEEHWHVHFIAFLSRAVSAPQVFGVLVRPSSGPDVPPEADQSVRALTLADPTQRILIATVTVNQTEGFASGQRIQFKLARRDGGHETIFARTEFTLQ